MRIYDIIAKKRDGLALSEEEIRFFVSQYTQGTVSYTHLRAHET